MSRFVRFAATFVFLCSGISIAAADDGGWVNCKDGMKMHGGGACANHGGVLIPATTTTPIDTTKGLTPNKELAPNKTATTTKPKTQKPAASTATQKKTVSKRSSSPTAKCNDGAMYFSTEHRGACASHGGVKNWL